MSISVGTPNELGVNSQEVANFYKREWIRKISLSDYDFYKWQFISVPYFKNQDHCCIAVDSKKIVGVMGVNNRYFMLDSTKLLGAELTTWVVKKEYRHRGVSLKIIDFIKNKYDVVVGMGISKEALPIYLRSGFHYLRGIPRYLKVMNWNRISEFSRYEPLAKKMDKLTTNKAVKSLYERLDVNKDRINKINTQFSLENNFFSRDFDYIKWRYIEHPYFRYHTYIISLEGEGVFVSLREEESKEGEIKVLHVVDMFGDEKDMLAAVSFVVDEAVNLGVDIIDFFGTNSKINSYYIKSGWFSILDDCFFSFPHLFQPLELREPATTSLIYWSKNDDINLFDIGKLYITKQDADFDRPIL